MNITLYYEESLEKNASRYFDKAKALKKKMKGAEEALAESLRKKKKILKEAPKEEEKQAPLSKEWYEKFRWFLASNGMLVLGGRDATTNDIVVKKHADEHDLIFHTDMTGSPFFVLKTEGKEVEKRVLHEVADATCSFSKAWQLGLKTQEIFYVNPEQVTKTPNTGEFLPKGAFVIRGKTEYIDNKVNVAVGKLEDGRLMCGPKESVKAHCKEFIVFEQGDKKPSEIAKMVKKEFKFSDLDTIIRILPTGGLKRKR